MKKQIDRSEIRGSAENGWLKTKYSFSFANYFNPSRMGFGALRVLNDDWIAPGKGFGTHPHSNMEIITIPLQGAIRHQDSIGHYQVISKGEIQVMSAGSGIAHSEINNSKFDPVELLQIWILPNETQTPPSYQMKSYSLSEKKNQFQLLVAPSGNALVIRQKAYLSIARLESGKEITYQWKDKANGLYLFLISGKILFADETLQSRDAIALNNAENVSILASEESEVLAIEVPLQ